MELIYRAVIVFLVGFLFLRLSGKKAVAEMHSFDLLYFFVLTNIISTPIEVNNLGKAIIYSGITFIIYKIIVRLSLHNKLRWLLYSSPTVLIRNGDIDRKGLKKVRMPVNELLSHLRMKGYMDTQNIAIAVME
ncbi:YetF domain-containing protein, partial [Bacillus sp. JJ1503]